MGFDSDGKFEDTDDVILIVCLVVLLQITSAGRRDYEGYIAKTHESFRTFRDSTIEKWSKRTKIASGKISSKVRKQLCMSFHNIARIIDGH